MDSSSGGVSLVQFVVVLVGAVTLWNYPSIDPTLRVADMPPSGLLPQYDFIIVGGGTAGCVLANRLSANSNWTVLVLEFGGDENTLTQTPMFAYELWRTSVDWNYTTVPQPRACLSMGGRCEWPRGLLLGGSSATNFMVYCRGNRRDFDTWQAMGNPGWGYSDVLPYFIRAEDNRIPYLANSPYHGHGGLLTVEQPPFHSPLADGLLRGGQELGFQVRDINGANQTGFMYTQATLRNGSRCSTARSYLRPARGRPNLHVSMHSYVTKIIIQGNAAVGVQFTRDGQTYNISARKEVIMTAGSLNTPKILMLSGIGPEDHLNEMNIPVVRNLPVGNNLQDHYGCPAVFTSPSSVLNTYERYMSLSSIQQYAQNNSGPLTAPIGIDVLAFLNSSLTDPALDYPDLELHLATTVPNFADMPPLWFSLGLVLHPRSRGTIRLQSTNPYAHPLMDPQYFSAPEDLQVVIEAFQYALKLVNTAALEPYNATFYPQFYTLCANYTPLSVDFIRCAAESYTTTIFHPVGTCRMGQESDSSTVVNPNLQVHGVSNLRVVDASVMPTIVGANTNAAVVMIAERGSDIITQYWTHNGN